MRLEGLDHIAISVADPEASAAWYAEVLDLKRHHEAVWGAFPIFMMAGSSGLAIFPRKNASQEPVRYEGASEFRHLAFRVDGENFDRAREELAARDIPTEFQDHQISHSIYFDDPDGVHLEITTYDLADRVSEMAAGGTKTEFLRHTIATLAYRGGKSIREAPRGFAEFSIGRSTRTPGEILAHIGDLLDWALSQAEGGQAWRDSESRSWEGEVERFFGALEKLDRRLASGEPSGFPEEKMFQGPIADALTHVGQIAMLRRLADSPVRGENYFKAGIEPGRVGADQAEPRREFD